jgi:hypothetical protein
MENTRPWQWLESGQKMESKALPWHLVNLDERNIRCAAVAASWP